MTSKDRNTPRSLVWLATLALIAAVAYALYPQQIRVEGVGLIQPVFETLEPIIPPESGRVLRLLTVQGQAVDSGAPILEYVRHGDYAVRGVAQFTVPGKGIAPEPEPEWYRQSQDLRVRRMGAVSRWSAAVYRPSSVRPAIWEYQLAARFNLVVAREADDAQETLAIQENERAGQADFNIPDVFDKSIGEYRPADEGAIVRSPDRGFLFSLWATPITQLFPRTPIGEIARGDAPMEILGVVPALPDADLVTLEQVRHMTVPFGSGDLVGGINQFDIGRVAIAARDLELITPSLTAPGNSYFIRLLLAQPASPSTVRASVRFELTSPKRPRAWFWWMAYRSKNHPRRIIERSPYAKGRGAVASP